jgi:hypothetical protein
MGCGPGVAGKSRSAGVFVVSIIFSTRTPGSIKCANRAPRISAAMAAAITQRIVRSPQHFLGDVISSVTVTCELAPPNGHSFSEDEELP